MPASPKGSTISKTVSSEISTKKSSRNIRLRSFASLNLPGRMQLYTFPPLFPVSFDHWPGELVIAPSQLSL